VGVILAASASRRSNKVFADNHPSLWWFFNKVKRLWLAALKRRSQTARLSWERVHPVRRPLLSANQNYTPAALSPVCTENPAQLHPDVVMMKPAKDDV
jgi:hypothetical protein